MKYIKVIYKPKRTVCIFVIMMDQCKVEFNLMDKNIKMNLSVLSGLPYCIMSHQAHVSRIHSPRHGRDIRENRLQ